MSTRIQTITKSIEQSSKPTLEKIRDLTSLYFAEGARSSARDLGLIVLTIEGIATKDLIMGGNNTDCTLTGQR